MNENTRQINGAREALRSPPVYRAKMERCRISQAQRENLEKRKRQAYFGRVL